MPTPHWRISLRSLECNFIVVIVTTTMKIDEFIYFSLKVLFISMENIPADIWYLIGLECDYPSINSLRQCNHRLWKLFSNQDFWWRMNLQIDRHVEPHFPWQIIDREKLVNALEECKRIQSASNENEPVGSSKFYFEKLFLCLIMSTNEDKVMPGLEKVLSLNKCLKRAFRSHDVKSANYFIEKAIESLHESRTKSVAWNIRDLQKRIRIVRGCPRSYRTRFYEWISSRFFQFLWKYDLHPHFWSLRLVKNKIDQRAQSSRLDDEIVVAYQSMPRLAYFWLLILIRSHPIEGRRKCRLPEHLDEMLNHIPQSDFLRAVEQVERDGIVMECRCLDFRRQYDIRARWWWNYLAGSLIVRICIDLQSKIPTSIYEFLIMVLLTILLYFTMPY